MLKLDMFLATFDNITKRRKFMFKKKMKQIGAMAMAASMILASVQLPPLAANAAENTNLALSATATGCKNFFYLISVILIHGRIGNNT